jgi:hypothetical protein
MWRYAAVGLSGHDLNEDDFGADGRKKITDLL